MLDGQALALAAGSDDDRAEPGDGALVDDGHAAVRDHASGEPA